jgi:hypothetical protein
LRATDVNSLEYYEKYFILYNSVSEKDYKIAAQYLWLFQKLNASSAESGDQSEAAGSKQAAGTLYENELNLFKYLTLSKNAANLAEMNQQAFQSKFSQEQRMHFRLILTIYLANS